MTEGQELCPSKMSREAKLRYQYSGKKNSNVFSMCNKLFHPEYPQMNSVYVFTGLCQDVQGQEKLSYISKGGGGEGGLKEGTGSADPPNFSAKLNLPVQIFLSQI